MYPLYAQPVEYRPRASTAHIVIAWVVTWLTGLYMLPWAIAATRSKRNILAIAMINLFLGWTVVGWVIALVLSCLSEPGLVAPAVAAVYAGPALPPGYPMPALPPGHPLAQQYPPAQYPVAQQYPPGHPLAQQYPPAQYPVAQQYPQYPPDQYPPKPHPPEQYREPPDDTVQLPTR